MEVEKMQEEMSIILKTSLMSCFIAGILLTALTKSSVYLIVFFLIAVFIASVRLEIKDNKLLMTTPFCFPQCIHLAQYILYFVIVMLFFAILSIPWAFLGIYSANRISYTRLLQPLMYSNSVVEFPPDFTYKSKYVVICNHMPFNSHILGYGISSNHTWYFLTEDFWYGRAVKKCLNSTMTVNRDQRGCRKVCVQEMLDKFSKDDNVALFIFPEGGMFETKKVEKFYSGAFVVSLHAQVPILMMVQKENHIKIVGYYDPLRVSENEAVNRQLVGRMKDDTWEKMVDEFNKM